MSTILLALCLSNPFTEQVASECHYQDQKTDIDRVVALREWAWANTTYCNGGKNALEVERRDWFLKSPAEELYSVMKTEPVMCGGAGLALVRLYQAFGFKSWGINFRVCPEFQHFATLVEIEHRGTKIVVQDPSFNIDFRDREGEPLSLEAIQALLQARRSDLVVVRDGRVLKWPGVRLIAPQTVEKLVRGSFAVDRDRYLVVGDRVESPRTWGNWCRKAVPVIENLKRAGWSGPVDLYAKTDWGGK